MESCRPQLSASRACLCFAPRAHTHVFRGGEQHTHLQPLSSLFCRCQSHVYMWGGGPPLQIRSPSSELSLEACDEAAVAVSTALLLRRDISEGPHFFARATSLPNALFSPTPQKWPRTTKHISSSSARQSTGVPTSSPLLIRLCAMQKRPSTLRPASKQNREKETQTCVCQKVLCVFAMQSGGPWLVGSLEPFPLPSSAARGFPRLINFEIGRWAIKEEAGSTQREGKHISVFGHSVSVRVPISQIITCPWKKTPRAPFPL